MLTMFCGWISRWLFYNSAHVSRTAQERARRRFRCPFRFPLFQRKPGTKASFLIVLLLPSEMKLYVHVRDSSRHLCRELSPAGQPVVTSGG